MKKTGLIKIFITACITALAAILPLCLTACYESENGNINLNMSYKIYDFNPQTMTSSETPNASTHIKVGQYYKVIFDITCDDLKASVQDDEVDVQMTVNMGDYENETNRTKLMDSAYVAKGGLKFSEKLNGAGVWVSTFTVTKDGLPDFSKSEFIICLRSLGSGSSIMKIENMTVEFSNVGKESNHKVRITGAGIDPDTGAAEYAVSLLPQPGEMTFSYEGNVTSTSVGINSVKVKVPSNCVNIVVDLYFDSQKSGIYGSKEYDFTGTASSKYLTVNFNDLMIEFTDEIRFNNLLNKPNPSVYVVMTANGGKSYSSVSFEYEQQLRG